jgi:hypothetical protein
MRRVSKKRQQLMRKAKPIRDALRDEVGCCEACVFTTRGPFDVHEICRGVHRAKALDKRFALLVVCRRCHEELGSAAEWPEARQLALLAKRRPQDFDLAAYLELTSPRAPRRIEMKEVIEYMDEEYLSKSDVAERLQVDRRTVDNWIKSGLLPAIDASSADSSRPLYRIAMADFLEFCRKRKVTPAQ